MVSHICIISSSCNTKSVVEHICFSTCYLVCTHLEHNVLKVVRTVVVLLVNHTIDNTLTISCVCPSKAISVIVQTIHQLPSIKFCTCCREIGITLMKCSKRFLTQLVCVRRKYNDIKLVPCTLSVRLNGSRCIVSNPIQLSW